MSAPDTRRLEVQLYGASNLTITNGSGDIYVKSYIDTNDLLDPSSDARIKKKWKAPNAWKKKKGDELVKPGFFVRSSVAKNVMDAEWSPDTNQWSFALLDSKKGEHSRHSLVCEVWDQRRNEYLGSLRLPWWEFQPDTPHEVQWLSLSHIYPGNDKGKQRRLQLQQAEQKLNSRPSKPVSGHLCLSFRYSSGVQGETAWTAPLVRKLNGGKGLAADPAKTLLEWLVQGFLVRTGDNESSEHLLPLAIVQFLENTNQFPAGKVGRSVMSDLFTVFQAHTAVDLLGFLRCLLAVEVARTGKFANLFRVDSPATFFVHKVLRAAAGDYYNSRLTPAMQAVVKSKATPEIDGSRLTQQPPSVLPRNQKVLQAVCKVFIDTILESGEDPLLPSLIRGLAQTVADGVGQGTRARNLKRAGGAAADQADEAKRPVEDNSNPNLDDDFWDPKETVILSLVSAFFLRFLCPTIVAPNTYGLLPENFKLSPEARRTLTLVGKTLQNVANSDRAAAQIFFKEPYMAVMHNFSAQYAGKVNGFLSAISGDRDANSSPAAWYLSFSQTELQQAAERLVKFVQDNWKHICVCVQEPSWPAELGAELSEASQVRRENLVNRLEALLGKPGDVATFKAELEQQQQLKAREQAEKEAKRLEAEPQQQQQQAAAQPAPVDEQKVAPASVEQPQAFAQPPAPVPVHLPAQPPTQPPVQPPAPAAPRQPQSPPQPPQPQPLVGEPAAPRCVPPPPVAMPSPRALPRMTVGPLPELEKL